MNISSYEDQPVYQKQAIMSLRTYNRNIPSQPLQPYLDARPAMSKYALLPIVENRNHVATPLAQQATYNSETIFNPGNDRGPWSGYASNVNKESDLRNQLYAHQKCSQATYVPSSDSTLYDIGWKNNSNFNQPFPGLFDAQQFAPVERNKHSNMVGFAMFNNATRQQTKDLTNPTKCL
jgi:hypothetical protein